MAEEKQKDQQTEQLVDLGGLRLVLCDERRDDSILVFQHPALREPFDDRVGRRRFPAQVLGAEGDKFAAPDRLVCPQNLAKAVFAFKNFRRFHLVPSLIC